MGRHLAIAIASLVATVISPFHAFAGPANHYSLPAFRGKVLDAGTKTPIEGAVVVALYSKETANPYGTGSYETILGLRETLTGKDGNFAIPPFAKVIEPSSIGNVEFIVLKPGYGAICQSDLLHPRAGLFQPQAKITSIAAIKPSVIDYIEVREEDINGQRYGHGIKVTKRFPEGLIFSVSGCEEARKMFENNRNFILEYFFLPFKDAIKKIKLLDVPLDCPDNVEPVPSVDTTYDNRNEIQKNIIHSFTVIELPKVKSSDEMENAIDSCDIFRWNITEKDLPILYQMTHKRPNEER